MKTRRLRSAHLPSLAALLTLSGLAQAATKSGFEPGDEMVIAGGVDTISEAILGPGAPGGIRPDNMPKPKPEVPGQEPNWRDRFALTLSTDWTTAYFFRGYRQEDKGFILQPAAALNFTAFKEDDFSLNLNLSTWHSFHDNETGATVTHSFNRKWYESDYIVGASVTAGKWSAGFTYAWNGGPSNGLEETQEAAIAVSFDDSDLLGPWSLKPTAMVIFEVAGGFSDGLGHGTYLQLGITPGFDVPITDKTALRVDFPVTAGFSLSRYYQDAGGGDQFFGYVQVGPKLSIPLPLADELGRWTVSGSASLIYMNDHAALSNGGANTQWVFGLGVSAAF